MDAVTQNVDAIIEELRQASRASQGVGAAALRALSQVDVRIANLWGARLGVAAPSGAIWIDRDAAGYGWSLGVESRGLRDES